MRATCRDSQAWAAASPERGGAYAPAGYYGTFAAITAISILATFAGGAAGAGRSGVATKGLSLNSLNLAMGVERASPELISGIRRHGRTVRFAAESFMIRHQRMLGLSAPDVAALRLLMEAGL